MTDRGTPTERLVGFTDAVFAVIMTIMVLDLKPPALRLEPGQAVIPHGPDRDLTVVEALPRDTRA
jgi:uncharacterized membrane protein